MAEAAGIVALLASLVFVAMEIKQSNKIAIASIQYDVLSDFNEYHRQVLADPEVAEFISILKKSDDRAFSPADEVRLHSFITIFINIWFAIHTAHENGQLTDDTYQIYLEDVQSFVLEYPRVAPYLKESIRRTPSILDFEIFQVALETNESQSR
jgi:hypothetical protein